MEGCWPEDESKLLSGFHFQTLQLCCVETFSVSCSPLQPIHIFVGSFQPQPGPSALSRCSCAMDSNAYLREGVSLCWKRARLSSCPPP